MRLSGKSALVVGGGTGIGLGIAKALASEGCQVVIAGRRDEVLQAAAASCEGLDIAHHTVDVADRESVATLVVWATEKSGKIDILVNSAGANIKTRTMREMTPDQWDNIMAINTTGAYNLMHQVLPQMRERKDGLIINVSSVAGKRAYSLAGIAYCASKSAMTALGTAVGVEEKDNGIRVTNIFPGEVETPLLEKRPEPVDADRRAKMLQPEDFADIVVSVACLPARANVAEIVIKPTVQEFI
jgi:NADP-dependent 3-hydroxy acid dehydrogenase YdfG